MMGNCNSVSKKSLDRQENMLVLDNWTVFFQAMYCVVLYCHSPLSPPRFKNEQGDGTFEEAGGKRG